jgi:hypothetical protein
VLRDPAKIKSEVLGELYSSSSRRLEESMSSIEEVKSILHWAKTPKDRTAINIILDDQRKVVKALERLVRDLEEMTEMQ